MTTRMKIVLGIAVPLALFVLIGSLTWYFQSAGQRRPLTREERSVLVTAFDLFAMSSQPQLYDATKETISEREELLDGSATLTTEYQSQMPPLYLVSHIALEPTESAAKLTWQADSIGAFMSLAVDSKNIVLKPADEVFSWGDDSKSQLLTIDGKPVGHFLVFRKGRRVFMALFTGVYFDERSPLAGLLTPKLEAMTRLP